MVWKNIQKIEGPYVPTPQQAPCKPGQWCYDSMIGVIKQNGALPVNSSSSSATASASSSSPVAPIQNLMNNWYAWGRALAYPACGLMVRYWIPTVSQRG